MVKYVNVSFGFSYVRKIRFFIAYLVRMETKIPWIDMNA